MKVHQPQFGMGNLPIDFFKKITEAPLPIEPPLPNPIEDIRNMLDSVKQSKLSSLITYCEQHDNQSLANRLKFNGIPKGIYAPSTMMAATRQCFDWMGCKIVEHSLLEPGQIVFSWHNDIYNREK